MNETNKISIADEAEQILSHIKSCEREEAIRVLTLLIDRCDSDRNRTVLEIVRSDEYIITLTKEFLNQTYIKKETNFLDLLK